MRGAEYAKRHVLAYQQATLPAKLDAIAVRLTAEYEADPAITIAHPALYDIVDHPIIKEGQYPAVLVEWLPSPPLRVARIDEAGNRVWWVTYLMRINVLAYARTEDAGGAAELLRDRLLLGVKEVLIDDLTLGRDDMAVDELTIRDLALPLIIDTPGRFVSAGAEQFALSIVEEHVRDLLAEAPTDITLTVTAPPSED